jgi:hypothetical protein
MTRIERSDMSMSQRLRWGKVLGTGLTALLAVGVVTPSAAQVRLDRPEAKLPDDFGSIQTVRELPDGRVLVADPLGKVLYVVDLGAGTRSVVGSEGEGPQEWRQPDAVWPLPGDSTLLVDLGNSRMVVLGPDLRFGPTMPLALSALEAGSIPLIAIPQGVDGQGRIYTRSLGGLAGQLPDSAAILRIDRATRKADTVALFKLPDRTQATSGGANNRNVRIANVPLSPEDAWGVAQDGAVAIARAGDYHVDWVLPDGRVVHGAPVPYDPVRIGTPEKEEYLAEQARSGGGIGISMQVVNGSATMAFARGGGPGTAKREIDQYTWPDEKPPMYQGRIPIDLQGRAWVHRSMKAGEPATYDVFDRAGKRVGTVTLGTGKRVIGFGKGWVYVVSFDDFDLSYLERFRMPAL